MVSDRKTDPPRSSPPSERLPLANQWTTIGEALTRATRTVGLTVLTHPSNPSQTVQAPAVVNRPTTTRGRCGSAPDGRPDRVPTDHSLMPQPVADRQDGQFVARSSRRRVDRHPGPFAHQPLAWPSADGCDDAGSVRPTIHSDDAGASQRIARVDRLAWDSCGRYLPEMVRIPEPPRRLTVNARPFFELIEQMESLLAKIDLDWPDEMRADAKRRLARIARALRHAPETSERLLDVS
jgi:hypothetical protein